MDHEPFEISEARIKHGDSSWEGFKKMSSDAKIWKDEHGWHGICDNYQGQIHVTEYELRYLIIEIEEFMEQQLNWEIFQFGNGLGLRGYRAK